MSLTKRKKKPSGDRSRNAAASPTGPPETGMPALDSITGVDEFRKGKKVLRIIHTNEVDEYDLPSKHKPKT